MAFTTYTLQTQTLPTGTATVKLLSGIAGLVIPTFNSLDVSSDVAERCDLIPGTVEFENMEFPFIEDDSYYNEGFWYKVLNDTAEIPEIQILLNEGSGDTMWFWGRLNEEDTPTFEEVDLTAGNIQRKGEFSCKHLIDKLRDLDLTTLMTEVDAIDSTGTDTHQYVKIQALISAMVSETFGYSFDITRCVVRGQPFRYKSSTTYYDFEDVWMKVGHGGVPIAYHEAWQDEYSSAYDLLNDLCRGFGYVPKLVWDQANDKWVIELLARGLAFQGLPISFEGVVTEKSEFTTHSQVIGAVGVGENPNSFVNAGTNVRDGHVTVDPIPASVTLDINFQLFWGFIAGTQDAYILYVDGGGTPAQITAIQYYDHSTGAYSSDETTFHSRSVAQYLWSIFGGRKRGYERGYPSVRSFYGNTLTHKNTSILKQHVMGDGTETSLVVLEGTAIFNKTFPNVTESYDETVFAIGTGSPKFEIADAHTTGVFAANNITSVDLSGYTDMRMWVRSSVALDAGDVTFGLDDSTDLASPLEAIDLPALAAGEFTQIVLKIATPSALTAIVSLGFTMITDKGAMSFWCDYIEALDTRMFYAIEVSKNIVNDNCSIKWQEV